LRKAKPNSRQNGNRKHSELETLIVAYGNDDGPYRMCSTADGLPKRRYLSRAEAKAYLKTRPDLTDMNTYRCTVCGYFHVGHRRKNAS
jgi:hypothetical protein